MENKQKVKLVMDTLGLKSAGVIRLKALSDDHINKMREIASILYSGVRTHYISAILALQKHLKTTFQRAKKGFDMMVEYMIVEQYGAMFIFSYVA